MMCLQQITQYMYLKLISSHAWTFKLFYLQVHYIQVYIYIYMNQLICLVLYVALYLNNCEQSNFLLFFSINTQYLNKYKFYNQ